MISQQENFVYDNIDRLKTIKHGTATAMSIDYIANGNITQKTGLGAYTYSSSKPHAVTEVANTGNLLPLTNQTITYNVFNKVLQIKDTLDNNAYQLDITYGPDRQRWKSVLKKNNAVNKTIIYAGDYEKITENGVTKELIYTPGGGIYVTQSGQTNKIYYAHTDHLGSIIKLTDKDGTVVSQVASYDAWGKRTVVPGNTFKFHRGYTGHEHLDEFGLINMNGRMYDPLLGMFLSPDNYVQAPDFSQSYNRYSYCLNNPLKYSDPSGELFGIDDVIIAAIIGAVVGTYTGGIIANDGQKNPTKWDYSSGKMWGYM
jgi:RHS repeat-associated protein